MEGLELSEITSSIPNTEQQTNTSANKINGARQSVYRRLFGDDVVNSSPTPKLSVSEDSASKPEESRKSATFLTVNPKEEMTRNSKEKEMSTEFSFIAPILYGKKCSTPTRRPLQSSPIKILDAPGLEDDFYLNLLDWEAKSNRVSVLLGGSEVYFWNANNLNGGARVSSDQVATSSLGRLRAINSDKGCVIKWSSANESLLAVGTKNGLVEIWDVERGVRMHNWLGHGGNRCGVLSWTPPATGSNFDGQLSSGGRDNKIIHYDLRTARGLVSQITTSGHTQEVCGLKYDHYGKNS